jgi:hypothetical protein
MERMIRQIMPRVIKSQSLVQCGNAFQLFFAQIEGCYVEVLGESFLVVGLGDDGDVSVPGLARGA